MTDLFYIVAAVQGASVFLSAVAHRKGDKGLEACYMIILYGAGAFLDLTFAGSCLLRHDYGDTGLALACAAANIFLAWRWWRKWKDRKKIAQLLGAKSRALREKLVRVMREGQQPSPVKVPS